MKKLVSPLPWVGSKRRLRDSIIPRIPDHICYVEPFAGGAWVYLGKEPSEVEVLNDINGDLINLYRSIRDEPDALYDAIWFRLASRTAYHESKQILERPDESGESPIERAATFYFHIKNAFGGRFRSGFAFSKTRPPRSLVAHELITSLRDRLLNTYIENLPFERVIKNYDAASTFFYLDPPYVGSGAEGCYRDELSFEDHTRLAQILRKIEGRFLLSYDDHPFVRKLYDGFKIELTEPVTYTLSGKAKQKRELLISNYNE